MVARPVTMPDATVVPVPSDMAHVTQGTAKMNVRTIIPREENVELRRIIHVCTDTWRREDSLR